MNYHLAKITVTKPLANLKELRIGNGRIRFFIDALESSLRFSEINERSWQLSFFPDSPYPKHYKITLSRPSEQPALNRKQKVILCIEGTDSNADLISKFKESISATQSIREGRHQTDLSDSRNVTQLVGARSSLGVLGSDFYFGRLILVQALGLAYADVFDEMMRKCKTAVEENDHETLLQLHEEALLFFAAHVYAHPIERDAGVMQQAWQHVYEQLNLRELEVDCIQQWERIGSICEAKSKRARQALLDLETRNKDMLESQHKKQTMIVACAGLALAAFTLVSILPSDIQTFVDSWSLFFQESVGNASDVVKTSQSD